MTLVNQELLAEFGIDQSARLGRGGEAEVYALDDERVLRVYHSGTPEVAVKRRHDLLDELQKKRQRVSFDVPNVIELIQRETRFVSIEQRLEGEIMMDVLKREVPDRKGLLRSYLNAARSIAELTPEREWYGDLVRDEPIRTQSFLEYALARAHDSLHVAGADFKGVSVVALSDALVEAPKSLVHMDLFPGNVMVKNGEVSAVFDFSIVSIIGDRRFDPIAAVAYLDPEISPCATDADRKYAMTWLESHELHHMYAPVKRWLAAFWSFARDADQLQRWSRRILLT